MLLAVASFLSVIILSVLRSFVKYLEAFSYIALDVLTGITTLAYPLRFLVREPRADQNRKEICR